MHQSLKIYCNSCLSPSLSSELQTIDTCQAMFLPIGASISLLIMFLFFDSLQVIFAVFTASKCICGVNASGVFVVYSSQLGFALYHIENMSLVDEIFLKVYTQKYLSLELTYLNWMWLNFVQGYH